MTVPGAGPLGLVLTDALDARGWAQTAARAEAAGASALWVTDHLVWHRPSPDPMAALALVAAATERCHLGPLVLQLPLRDTAPCAKSLAFLDHLAPGRVVVGVGVGEHRSEYEAAGVGSRYERRGRLLDEAINVLRSTWAEGAAHGLAPAPRAPLPIWVGGRSAAARRRAARLGDGWVPHLCRPEWFAEQVAALDADLAAVGRRPAEVRRGVVVAVSVDGIEPTVDPAAWMGRLLGAPPSAFERVLARGGAPAVAAAVARYRSAGAAHVALLVAGDRPVDHLEALVPLLASA